LFVLTVNPALFFAQSQQEIATNSDAGVAGYALPAVAIPKTTTTLRVVADDPSISTSLVPVPVISQAEILSSAGTFGDISRYLQVLPGVVGVSDLSNDMLVRGGHPTENLYVVDGVEVPNINHFSLSSSNGGFTSMIDGAAVKSMSMRPGVYDADYSSRLSSLIDIHTSELGEARQAGDLSVGIAGAGGLYQRALAHKGSLLLSAHRSIINLVTNDIGIDGVPIYTNGLARLELNLGDRDSISVFSLNGADSIDLTPCPVLSETSNIKTQYSGWRTTDALGWRHNFSARVTANLTFSSSLTRQNIAQQQETGVAYKDANGNCVAVVEPQPIYEEDSLSGLSALNYEVQADARGWLFSFGANGKLATPHDSVAQPAGELSPFSADPSRSDAVTFHRDFSTGQLAAFFQADHDFGARWKLMAGLRAESFAITGGCALDPRISATYKLNKYQSINGSMNIALQLPPMMDMISYESNRGLKPTQAWQGELGMRLLQAKWGTLDVDAYWKNYRREAVSTEYPALMLSNMVDTLGQAFVWLPLESTGTAQGRGLEATLRAHWGSRLQLLVSAALSQSTYRALDGIRRPGNYDTPGAMNAMGNLRLPRAIQLNVRESLASGRPYTPFDLADSYAQNRGIYDLTRVNALRGPLYNRTDLEIERHFRIRKGTLELHGGYENVFNRGNMQGYMWLYNLITVDPMAKIVKVDQVGRYPVFSVRYRF
jgi:hypothetical protein